MEQRRTGTGCLELDHGDTLVNSANAHGMGILAVLNSTPAWAVPAGDPAVATPPANDAQYAQFASAVAQRYTGKVSAYEVWNEPNAATFWYPSPNPAAYTQLLQAAYPAIKAADPSATVIGGVVGWVTDAPGLAISPAEYIQDMYKAGAKGYFDALSYHPYQYQIPFGQGGAYGSASPINQLALMHQEMVAAGDGSKQIWASEYGEPTSVVSPTTQASFISNFLNSWSSFSYTGPMFIYTTRDRNTGSTNAQDTFGVFQTNWTPKPAAGVIAQWTATHPQTVSLLDPVAKVAATAATVMGGATAVTMTAAGDATAASMTAAGDATAVTMTAAGDAAAATETAASTVVASAAGSTSSGATPSGATAAKAAVSTAKAATTPGAPAVSASKSTPGTSGKSTAKKAAASTTKPVSKK